MRVYISLLACALVVWAFCGAIMGIGRAVTSLEATLMLHLVGAPLGAGVMAWVFHRFVGEVSPVGVAGTFVGVSLFLDLALVAPVFERSFEMFASVIGLWLPQALIFLAAWLVGRAAQRPAPV